MYVFSLILPAISIAHIHYMHKWSNVYNKSKQTIWKLKSTRLHLAILSDFNVYYVKIYSIFLKWIFSTVRYDCSVTSFPLCLADVKVVWTWTVSKVVVRINYNTTCLWRHRLEYIYRWLMKSFFPFTIGTYLNMLGIDTPVTRAC